MRLECVDSAAVFARRTDWLLDHVDRSIALEIREHAGRKPKKTWVRQKVDQSNHNQSPQTESAPGIACDDRRVSFNDQFEALPSL